jgi:hypothetical protein
LAAASVTPAENVNAASTPSTPATAPISAGRTGSADRPRPGSSAKRVPISIGTGAPALAAPAAKTERREGRRERPAASAVAAATAHPASTSSGAAAQPTPRTSQSALIPGCGSSMEATPIGIHRDATTAPVIPRVAPATAARPGAAQAAAVVCRGVMPGALRSWRSATVAEL